MCWNIIHGATYTIQVETLILPSKSTCDIERIKTSWYVAWQVHIVPQRLVGRYNSFNINGARLATGPSGPCPHIQAIYRLDKKFIVSFSFQFEVWRAWLTLSVSVRPSDRPVEAPVPLDLRKWMLGRSVTFVRFITRRITVFFVIV